ncbi:hypothetical protein [Candidatus Liberibacter africanus]|uniref:hypothetical protein n=1 Tax=Liberibacter africanus TaxID=34020 RepID=UPI0011DE538B|nr:hypothetical protein [Candidatus Liberibacter africanus]
MVFYHLIKDLFYFLRDLLYAFTGNIDEKIKSATHYLKWFHFKGEIKVLYYAHDHLNECKLRLDVIDNSEKAIRQIN